MNERIYPLPPPLPDDFGKRRPFRAGGSPSDPREERMQIWRRYLGGVLTGTAVSAFVWFPAYDALVKNGSGHALYLVALAKLTLAIVGFCTRGWRSFAVGILVSIPVGSLILYAMWTST
ncbi:MAG: hypothetical protein JWP03_5497 [Phycisphaerales bacterium]|nr:hypothetical protein [Phycisphaerales bacterium]